MLILLILAGLIAGLVKFGITKWWELIVLGGFGLLLGITPPGHAVIDGARSLDSTIARAVQQ